MTLSDTIRRAALGPTPKSHAGYARISIASWDMGWEGFNHVYNVLEQSRLYDRDAFYDAPEEVQRMFLCFVAESCE